MNTEKEIKQAIMDEVKDQHKDEAQGIEIHNKLLTILEKMDGGKITKRIATALQKEMPEHTIFYDTQYSSYYIYVWGNGIKYDNRYMINIGTALTNRDDMKENIIDSKMFHNHFDCCHGVPAQERNARREAILNGTADIEPLVKAIQGKQKANEEMEELFGYKKPLSCLQYKMKDLFDI